tara:strand:- start:969 stop:1430 length:462 start_codon:yes stop_codon:yes gene_type:complete
MKFHQLNYIIEENFLLIAIHSSIEIFQIAYLINLFCKTNFIKSKKDIILSKEQANFDLYEWKINHSNDKWHLFSNKFSVIEKKNKNKNLLFDDLNSKNVFFMEEFKNVDFFLKKECITNSDDLIKKINLIPEISASYQIKKNNFTLKHDLIFD